MLVQILGVKESRDLEQGFGAAMQNLLSGGLDKAHAERWGRAGRGVVGGKGKWQMENDGNLEGSWESMDGGGKDGRDGKGGQWREHLKGRVWERFVDGMAWTLERGGGEGREFRCSHCSDGNGSSSSSTGEGCSSSHLEGTEIPKGMYVSGMGATDFALCVAAVLSTPQYRTENDLYCQDGNTASKTWVEDAAIETARERLRRGAQGERRAAGRGEATTASALQPASASAPAVAAGAVSPSGAARVGVGPVPVNTKPVNTNPVIAIFTYWAVCILQWARTYSSELIPASQCCKDSPQRKVRPMRHPLRDLPSLLVRLGSIPKPVDQGGFPWEWEEWPRGDEAVVKLPDDPSARFFRLGIVEEASGAAEECGAREKGGQRSSGQGPKAESKMGAGRGQGGGNGMGKPEGSSKGHGKEERIRGLTSEDQRGLHRLLTDLLPLVQRKYPIVRYIADAEFLVEFAGCMIKPPACAQCKECFALFNLHIPFLGVVANYAYRPASILFNRFVSIFPLHSQQFNHLTGLIGLPPFPASVPGFLRSLMVQARAEQVPIVFLLHVAHNWPLSILGIRDLQHFHRREWEEEQEGLGVRHGREEVEEEEEGDGRVWEEVRTWCLAVLSAWAGSWKLASFAGSSGAGGRSSGSSGSGGSGRSGSNRRGSDGRSRNSSNKGSRGDDEKGKKEEEPAYLKTWLGGVNLVACLQEMLLGEPCYRPASPAAPSTAAAPATPAAHSAPDPSSTPPAPPAVATPCKATAPFSVTGGSGSAACGGRVCGAAGCGTVEGGGVKLKNCSGCGKVAYSSRECQKAHRPSHKLTCPGRTSGRGGGSSGKVSGIVSETRWQQQGVWQGE
ncbi:unnamed protein product [Closterium sp. Naga37s-1]|nr:unnamed protein product [Closterium sp. Naga37s-1]